MDKVFKSVWSDICDAAKDLSNALEIPYKADACDFEPQVMTLDQYELLQSLLKEIISESLNKSNGPKALLPNYVNVFLGFLVARSTKHILAAFHYLTPKFATNITLKAYFEKYIDDRYQDLIHVVDLRSHLIFVITEYIHILNLDVGSGYIECLADQLVDLHHDNTLTDGPIVPLEQLLYFQPYNRMTLEEYLVHEDGTDLSDLIFNLFNSPIDSCGETNPYYGSALKTYNAILQDQNEKADIRHQIMFLRLYHTDLLNSLEIAQSAINVNFRGRVLENTKLPFGLLGVLISLTLHSTLLIRKPNSEAYQIVQNKFEPYDTDSIGRFVIHALLNEEIFNNINSIEDDPMLDCSIILMIQAYSALSSNSPVYIYEDLPKIIPKMKFINDAGFDLYKTVHIDSKDLTDIENIESIYFDPDQINKPC